MRNLWLITSVLLVAVPLAHADDPGDLVYSTYLGSSGHDGTIGDKAVLVDSAGFIYLVGTTTSTDFPTTPGAYDTTHSGGWDTFVAKMFPTGNGSADLIWSTFLGGTGRDWGVSIARDSAGNLYVAGYTTSADFPTTPAAYDTTHNGYFDVYVAKLDPTGSTLLFSTFLGGQGGTDVTGEIALDGSGNVYVAGLTRSTDFPTTAGAYDTSHNGPGLDDGFIAKLAPGGGSLIYSTFLGGSDSDQVWSLGLDSSGNGLDPLL